LSDEISDLNGNFGDPSLEAGKVLIRKWATTTLPSFGAWGSEESNLPARWLCCLYCNSPVGVKRMGSVGVKGVKDSDLFKCECCGSTFKVKGGEPFPEGLRSKGL